MAELARHLEQISACASSIAEINFADPKAFTNAQISPPTITSLIRDVEPHERSLFSCIPPHSSSNPHFQFRAPKRNTAVASVLGRDLFRRVADAKTTNAQASVELTGTSSAPSGDQIDVGVLLQGAERLCAVYPNAATTERISTLKTRYERLRASIVECEQRVRDNAAQLDEMQQQKSDMFDIGSNTPVRTYVPQSGNGRTMSAQDMAKDEYEIRQLERKKAALEERVHDMEKDLGLATT